jgi:hypothetical protein
MQATEVAELARVEKIKTKSQRAHWSTRPSDPGPSRKATNSCANAPDTDTAEARLVTRRPTVGGSMIERARNIFDFL